MKAVWCKKRPRWIGQRVEIMSWGKPRIHTITALIRDGERKLIGFRAINEGGDENSWPLSHVARAERLFDDTGREMLMRPVEAPAPPPAPRRVAEVGWEQILGDDILVGVAPQQAAVVAPWPVREPARPRRRRNA